MFGKKQHVDVKKSSLKLLDSKKDTISRLKHLRVVLDNLEVSELKSFFENSYSHIYYTFYDVFISVEGSLKQRVHKAYREELESVRFVFEKILLLLPELLHKKWQCHSIKHILKKMLHHGNSTKLRVEGVRMFLLWYQILEEESSEDEDAMFCSIVPGIIPGVPNPYLSPNIHNRRGISATAETYPDYSTFYTHTATEADSGPVCPIDVSPLLPPQTGDQPIEDPTKLFLECLLDGMVTQVVKIEWKEKTKMKQQRCFNFLFEKFKKYYLPHIFPKFSWDASIYKPKLELPELRQEQGNQTLNPSDTLAQCQAVMVRWVANYTHYIKKNDPTSTLTFRDQRADLRDGTSDKKVTLLTNERDTGSAVNLMSGQLSEKESNTTVGADDISLEYNIVQSTLYSSRENVNLVHEIFRQAFHFHFHFAPAMRRVVAAYKDWINSDVSEQPVFMQCPSELEVSTKEEAQGLKKMWSGSSTSSQGSTSTETVDSSVTLGSNVTGVVRLRNDSYLRAVHCDQIVKAGLQNVLQIFITNAANVFLLEVTATKENYLEEQVDMCKRVLNIYRYMVMNLSMERKTWEQLLLTLLQITSSVLKETLPVKKEDTLGGRLAPALFQTLIVTWIKASLQVVISTELWDQYLHVLSNLTQWEELIREWAKTMETVTRVMARIVYGLDLNDLPLQRLTEQKQKKRKGTKTPHSAAMENKISTEVVKSSVAQSEKKLTSDASEQHEEFSRDYTSSREQHDIDLSIKCRSASPMRMGRSVSDSHLLKKKASRFRKHPRKSSVTDDQKTSILSAISPNLMTEEIDRVLAPAEEYIRYQELHTHYNSRFYMEKCKSLDFLPHRSDSPGFSEISDFHSCSPSPTPSSGLESTSIKDSPMQIDVIVSASEVSCSNQELGAAVGQDVRSVMAGGTKTGWLPDVAVVLWKRMLGALGNINQIKDPAIHAQVLDYLIQLSDTLIKIRENLGVTVDNQSSPPPPELVPPLHLIVPWLFETIHLPEQYHQGRLLAYRLLCALTVRRHDLPLPQDYLVKFYQTLHQGLISTEQDVINTIVKYTGPKLFSIGLPGCTLLFMDFIHACNTIVSSTELKEVPRTEAVSILASLLCFPNLYHEIPTLQSNSTDMNIWNSKDAKDHILSFLIKAGKREPAALARCVAISALGIFLYEELMHKLSHSRLKEAIHTLLSALRPSTTSSRDNRSKHHKFNNKTVAQVASDMLLLVCDHAVSLQQHHPDLPQKIIEVIASTLSSLLPSSDASPPEEDKNLILSLIFCLAEWCMKLPLAYLLHTYNGEQSIFLTVFKVLNMAVSGKDRENFAPSTSSLLTRAGSDIDLNIHLDNLKEGSSPAGSSSPNSLSVSNSPEKSGLGKTSSFLRASSLQLAQNQRKNVIKLAARKVMAHLVNHVGHFPMGLGASSMTSLVNEHDDIPFLTGDELSTEVFHAPNIQFFVLNNCSIVSFVELPTSNVQEEERTSQLTCSKSQVRVIVRDLCGKFCWDCSLMYGPADCGAGSYPPEPVSGSSSQFLPPASFSVSSSSSMFSSTQSLSGISSSPKSFTLRHRSPDKLPTVEDSADDLDNLDDLLQFIGHTSSECVLHPEQPLNAPPATMDEACFERETHTMNLILNQRNYELNHQQKHASDKGMVGKKVHPPDICDPQSPFQHCRLLLDQLGFTSWEKRPTFDLLKKNEKLLRELRNLDNQKCRETHKIAVIYVAEGQEDKNSILSNQGGSQAFEEFVAGLGWEVELETHTGFTGGLQKNRSTGDTAPYYATSFMEVIFHVSTRMSTSLEGDSMNKKVRHLGNDEVHIVWSEHTRDYRRGIIATEFCDVLIVIYPLHNQLYRIQISRKPEVPHFGPLYSGAIIDHKVLPGLVRSTAINASRSKRSLIPLYQNFYEERARSLETIVQNHKELSTFEYFAAATYSPAPPRQVQPPRNTGTVVHSGNANLSVHTNLAAALLDSHGAGSSSNSAYRTRPLSFSTGENLSPRSSPQPFLRMYKERPLSASQSHTSSPLSHHGQ
ncbi:ral GTPase-activating protein subunit alpha-1 isoform X2 [Tachypleus tridentatus]|uniref:ral GTPase-activating protein subunit alpha-1 isoform X2 n=1 Tax=Tachypleus tridentatus TaxID=6853 RepID=UPI003FD27DE3